MSNKWPDNGYKYPYGGNPFLFSPIDSESKKKTTECCLSCWRPHLREKSDKEIFAICLDDEKLLKCRCTKIPMYRCWVCYWNLIDHGVTPNRALKQTGNSNVSQQAPSFLWMIGLVVPVFPVTPDGTPRKRVSALAADYEKHVQICTEHEKDFDQHMAHIYTSSFL